MPGTHSQGPMKYLFRFFDYYVATYETIEISIEIYDQAIKVFGIDINVDQIWFHQVEHLGIGRKATEVDNEAIVDAKMATGIAHEAVGDDPEAVSRAKKADNFEFLYIYPMWTIDFDLFMTNSPVWVENFENVIRFDLRPLRFRTIYWGWPWSLGDA